MIKQVIIVPIYLGMSPGKTASQCCHAAVKPALEGTVVDKRIILRGETPEEIQKLWRHASKVSGLKMRFSIMDEGLTEVPPHSITAISFVGSEEIVDKITGSLKLL